MNQVIPSLVIIFSSSEVLAEGPLSKEELYSLVQNLMIDGRYGIYDEFTQEQTDKISRMQEELVQAIRKREKGVHNINVDLGKPDGKYFRD